jgi:predicted aldo/keto reductase-like oxidoreductase
MESFLTCPASSFGKPVCRLGLASRGQSAIGPDDVLDAVGAGVNFLNWPAESEGATGLDGVGQAIATLGRQRESVVICIQLAARTAEKAARELRSVLAKLNTDYLDVVTLYYVETAEEWESLIAPGGVVAYCQQAKADGVIRRLGITSHQRRLAAQAAGSGMLDALMIRYNAAHRGAEKDVFPLTDALRMPVIAYTALRWGALLSSTPDDPPGFVVPSAADWYRFALESKSVAVTLAAPGSRAEFAGALEVLKAHGPLAPAQYEQLALHGDRVRRHAGVFP